MHADLGQHPQWRDPGRDAEFPRKLRTVVVLHEAGIDEDAIFAPLSKDEGKRQVHDAFVIHPADKVDPRLIFGARILHHIHVPGRWLGHHALLSPPPRFVRTRERDGGNQNRALEDVLRKGRRSEDVEAVEAKNDNQRADKGPEHVEFAVTKRGRPKEHRGEGSEKIEIGCVRRAAAKSRGEQRPGQRSANRRDDEAEDLDAVDVEYPQGAQRSGCPPTA